MENMRFAVLLGYNDSDGTSEALASGTPTEMNVLAKEMTLKNKTRWPKVRIFDTHCKQYKTAPTTKKSKKSLEAE